MIWGLPFCSWFLMYGFRALCILLGIVCVAFDLYEGRKKDDDWYWTF